MEWPSRRGARILGIHPYRRGFGFAVIEDFTLLDWGLARVRSKTRDDFVMRIEALVDQYRVTGFAVEDGSNRRRSTNSLAKVAAAIEYSVSAGLTCTRLSRRAVFEVFGFEAAEPNHLVNVLLADYFPDLTPLLPPRRRFFENEDERVNVFRAVALAAAAFSVTPTQ